MNPQLSLYIESERAKSIPDAQIAQALVASGWQQAEVNAALGGYAQPLSYGQGIQYGQPGRTKRHFLLKLIIGLLILAALAYGTMMAIGLSAMSTAFNNPALRQIMSALGHQAPNGSSFADQMNNLAKNIPGELGGNNSVSPAQTAPQGPRQLVAGESTAYDVAATMLAGTQTVAGDPQFLTDDKIAIQAELSAAQQGAQINSQRGQKTPSAADTAAQNYFVSAPSAEQKCLTQTQLQTISNECAITVAVRYSMLSAIKEFIVGVHSASEAQIESIKMATNGSNPIPGSLGLGQFAVLGTALNAGIVKTEALASVRLYLAYKGRQDLVKALDTWNSTVESKRDPKTDADVISMDDPTFWNAINSYLSQVK